MKAQRIVFFGWRESLFSVLVTEPVSWLWLDWGVSEVLSQRMVTANMVPSNLRRYLIMRNAWNHWCHERWLHCVKVGGKLYVVYFIEPFIYTVNLIQYKCLITPSDRSVSDGVINVQSGLSVSCLVQTETKNWNVVLDVIYSIRLGSPFHLRHMLSYRESWSLS